MYSTFGKIVLLRAYGICEYENQNKLAPNPWRNDPIPHPINTEPLRQALKTGPAPSSSINIALIAARPAPTSSPTNSPSGCRNPSTESTVQGSNCRIEEASTTGLPEFWIPAVLPKESKLAGEEEAAAPRRLRCWGCPKIRKGSPNTEVQGYEINERSSQKGNSRKRRQKIS
jgi:hypothetical protein